MITTKIISLSLVTLALAAVAQEARALELINTATNEIAQVQDIAQRDLLEEIYADLDARANVTDSTFILVEQENGSVTLFNIDYPYEDYAETDIPMVELDTFELMDLIQ